jgi:hypothetical protein
MNLLLHPKPQNEGLLIRVVRLVAVLSLLVFSATASDDVRAVRLPGNPILSRQSSPTLDDNLNGPSLIRVPDWVEKPLGRYYLYFAHHEGKFIRLAYANGVEGPWTVYAPGTLQLSEVSHCHDHIASPDVHVDERQRQIRMYFHCPAEGTGRDIEIQKTFVALSRDGLHFSPILTPLGDPYFRVFRWRHYYYALARAGVLLRSRDGLTPFEAGPTLFDEDPKLVLRHAAVDVQGNRLAVYYSRIGDRPERILLSYIALLADWRSWKPSPPVTVISPETPEEGIDRPLAVSKIGEAEGRVRELRDPAIFHDRGKTYLLYSIAGESGLSIAQLVHSSK